VPLSGSIPELPHVEKVFLGVGTNFCRGAGTVAQKRRRGTHHQSNFHPVVFVSSLRGVGLPIIDLNGRAMEFFNQFILDFFNSIGQKRTRAEGDASAL
jgi:hypothetical protein